jgi:uncharacterized protein (TIGR02145 family)
VAAHEVELSNATLGAQNAINFETGLADNPHVTLHISDGGASLVPGAEVSVFEDNSQTTGVLPDPGQPVCLENFKASSRTFNEELTSGLWLEVVANGKTYPIMIKNTMFESSTMGKVYIVYYNFNGEMIESSSSSETEPVESSSSEKAKSSSSGTEPVGDVLTDDRDGQTYKIVVIGSQTWMAENLNYATPKSYCFKDSAANCDTYGRLYTWDAAMDSAGVWSTNGKGCGYGVQCVPTYPVRGICPEGWHLPSKEDWEELFSVVGDPSISGVTLRSTSGWAEGKNGTDAYHFAALPAGVGQGVTNTNFFNKEWATYFTSSSDDEGFVYSLLLNAYDDDQLLKTNKTDWLSVRCLKD